jgi:hypothetical protein
VRELILSLPPKKENNESQQITVGILLSFQSFRIMEHLGIFYKKGSNVKESPQIGWSPRAGSNKECSHS